MKKLIALLLLILPLTAMAQDVKIAFVDRNVVLQAMPEFATFQKQMQEFNEKLGAELKQMQDEFQKKSADYIAAQDSLTENIKLRRMQELQDMQARIENFMQIAQQDSEKKQSELFEPIQKKLMDAIKAVGAEKGFTYILDPQIIMYTGSNAIDATPMVKTKLGI